MGGAEVDRGFDGRDISFFLWYDTMRGELGGIKGVEGRSLAMSLINLQTRALLMIPLGRDTDVIGIVVVIVNNTNVDYYTIYRYSISGVRFVRIVWS